MVLTHIIATKQPVTETYIQGRHFFSIYLLWLYNVAENIGVQCIVHIRQSDLTVNHKFQCCIQLVIGLLKTLLYSSVVSTTVFFKTH